MPDDLQRVLNADSVASQRWEALSPQQKGDWLQYLAEARGSARRAIRLANLLMSLTDG